MTVFDQFKRAVGLEKEANAAPVESVSTSGRGKINLLKEKVKISLEKNNLTGVKAKVAVVLDKSGSMRGLYNDGVVQETIERLVAVASKMDDNGELEVWVFDNFSTRLPAATEHNCERYIKDHILGRMPIQYGTSYAPVMKDVIKKYTKEEPDSSIPVYVLFVTDGENDDHENTERVIADASRFPIFWQYIGIGDEKFKFLKKLDEMDGRVIDNANFFQLNDLRKISDEELYDRMLAEFPEWIKLAKKENILR